MGAPIWPQCNLPIGYCLCLFIRLWLWLFTAILKSDWIRFFSRNVTNEFLFRREVCYDELKQEFFGDSNKQYIVGCWRHTGNASIFHLWHYDSIPDPFTLITYENGVVQFDSTKYCRFHRPPRFPPFSCCFCFCEPTTTCTTTTITTGPTNYYRTNRGSNCCWSWICCDSLAVVQVIVIVKVLSRSLVPLLGYRSESSFSNSYCPSYCYS